MNRTVVALLTVALLPLLAGCPDSSKNSSISNSEVCDDIHSAINLSTLDTRGAEAQIKLAGARAGVTDRIRAAIDTYYRGDKDAGRQAMLSACAVAGYPAK